MDQYAASLGASIVVWVTERDPSFYVCMSLDSDLVVVRNKCLHGLNLQFESKVALNIDSMPSITFSMAILVTGTLSASISKGSDAFRLPMQDPSPEQRAQQINYHRQGYLYGPSVIGNSSYFPTGPLGDELVARQVALSKAVADPNAQTIIDEATPVYEAVQV